MRLRDALPVVGLLRQRRVLERLRGADGGGRGQTGGVHAVQLGAESGNFFWGGFIKLQIYIPTSVTTLFLDKSQNFGSKIAIYLNKKFEEVAILFSPFFRPFLLNKILIFFRSRNSGIAEITIYHTELFPTICDPTEKKHFKLITSSCAHVSRSGTISNTRSHNKCTEFWNNAKV